MGGLTIDSLSQRSWNVSEVRPDVKFPLKRQTPPLNGPNLMIRPSPLQGRGPWVMGLIPLTLTLSVRVVELNKNSDYLAKSISYLCTRDTHWLHFSSLSFLLFCEPLWQIHKIDVVSHPRYLSISFHPSSIVRQSQVSTWDCKTWQHSPTFTKSLSYLLRRYSEISFHVAFDVAWIPLGRYSKKHSWIS